MKKRRILVIHHGALGDVVSIFPALLRLRQSCDSIAIICQSNIGQLAREFKIVDQWFPLEASVVATLYSYPDQIDPVVKNIFLSYGKIVLFSRSRTLEKTLYSISKNEVYLIQPRPDLNQKIHVAEHILSNFVRYGLLEESDKDTRMTLSSLIYADRRIPGYAPLKVIIHPGAGSPKKCWSKLNFVKVASLLSENGKQPEFMLGPAEFDLYGILSRQKTLEAQVHKIDELKKLAGLLKTGGGFIGNDSGVSHLAAFLGLPTVAVFGPSDPHVWKPMGRAVKVVQSDLDCRPCLDIGTVGCDGFDCFDRITPVDVLKAFDGLVG